MASAAYGPGGAWALPPGTETSWSQLTATFGCWPGESTVAPGGWHVSVCPGRDHTC